MSNVNRSSGSSAGSLAPSCQSNTAVAAKVAETAIDDAQPRDVAHNQKHKSSSAQAIGPLPTCCHRSNPQQALPSSGFQSASISASQRPVLLNPSLSNLKRFP